MRDLIKLVPNVHYTFAGGSAITLTASAVSEHPNSYIDRDEPSTRKHVSGWTIQGHIVEDFVQWVNDFEAVHPMYGTVKGNFEAVVWCTSFAGFAHFMANHAPELWDYHDV